MEKLCKIRDIQRSIMLFEQQFQKCHGLCLNEGMLLCSLDKSDNLSSGELSDLLGLTTSNTSKVIASVEKKKLIKRIMGDKDKRQMRFSLTKEGEKCIKTLQSDTVELPKLLETILGCSI